MSNLSIFKYYETFTLRNKKLTTNSSLGDIEYPKFSYIIQRNTIKDDLERQ